MTSDDIWCQAGEILAEVSKIAATFGTVHEGIHWNIVL